MKRLIANLFLIIGFSVLYSSFSHGVVFCKGKGAQGYGHNLGYKIEKHACPQYIHPEEITDKEFVYGFLTAGKSRSINDLKRIEALFKKHRIDNKIIKDEIFNRDQLSPYRKFLAAENIQIAKAGTTKEKTVLGSGQSVLLKSKNHYSTSQFHKELCDNSKNIAIQNAIGDLDENALVEVQDVKVLDQKITGLKKTRWFSGRYKKCYVEVEVKINLTENKFAKAGFEEFKGIYEWGGKKVTRDTYCKKARSNKMNEYYPDKYEKMCEVLSNEKLIAHLYDGISLNDLKKNYSLNSQQITELIENKKDLEKSKIDEYLQANLRNEDLNKFNLEKETIELLKVKRQERKETLYSKSCTGLIFGHKKGTSKWYECLDEKEQEDLSNTSLIAKIDTNQKEEKTKEQPKIKKVTKKNNSSQEEFKPKQINQDKDPPIIKIAESITVNDSSYEISGTLEDKSKKLFIEVDGQTIPVKKGKFTINRYSPINEKVKLVAIDQWGNKSKPKIINIIVDIKNVEVADKIEPLKPKLIRSRKNNDRIALIIGIEKYERIPSASYANLDAKFFYEYARKGFGISKNNIKLLIDEDADLVQSLSTLNKWLPSKIKSGQTELIIFFAGHGLASSDGKELYILPQDSDPDLLNRTALSRTELFKEIINLNPKSVTMFMDTCYSGISRDEKMLLASARPVRIVTNNDNDIPGNFTIFSASQLDQISSGIKEANHGIFSYYLMKGLEGNADLNKDRNITNAELLAYMDENVSQKASELGREQNPTLSGDPSKVLMTY